MTLANKDASINGATSRGTAPASVVSNWVDLVTAVNVADNGGSTVLNPVAIVRDGQGRLNMLGAGTTVQFRFKYTTGLTITAGTIQPFGLDANGCPERLFDGSTVPAHALSFLSDASNDAQDGTKSYTASQEVDANGAAQIVAAIKTAATGTGAATAVLQARIK